MTLQTLSVKDFPAPRERPLSYPGHRPGFSFLLSGGVVHPIRATEGAPPSEWRINSPGLDVTVDEFLAEIGAASVSDRFAVLGYGSNPVPGQLESKFGPDAAVPVIRAEMKGVDMVYNLISNMGYAYAELYIDAPPATLTQVAITLLDLDQLQRMDETEENYVLAPCPTDVFTEGRRVLRGGEDARVYLFAGFRHLWVPQSYGTPVAVAELPSRGRVLSEMTQREAWALAISEFALVDIGVCSPQALVDRIREEAELSAPRGGIKAELQAKIEASARSQDPLADQLPRVDLNDACPMGLW